MPKVFVRHNSNTIIKHLFSALDQSRALQFDGIDDKTGCAIGTRHVYKFNLN